MPEGVVIEEMGAGAPVDTSQIVHETAEAPKAQITELNLVDKKEEAKPDNTPIAPQALDSANNNQPQDKEQKVTQGHKKAVRQAEECHDKK